MFSFLGYIALTFNILSFLSKKTRQALKLNIVATSTYALNVFIMSYHTAALIGFLGTIITIFALFNDHKLKNIFIKMSPIIALFIIIYINDYSLGTLFPIIGFSLATIAKMQEDILKMKYWFIGSALCWLSLGLYIGDSSVFLYDIFGLLSLLYIIHKIKKDRKKF